MNCQWLLLSLGSSVALRCCHNLNQGSGVALCKYPALLLKPSSNLAGYAEISPYVGSFTSVCVSFNLFILIYACSPQFTLFYIGLPPAFWFLLLNQSHISLYHVHLYSTSLHMSYPCIFHHLSMYVAPISCFFYMFLIPSLYMLDLLVHARIAAF